MFFQVGVDFLEVGLEFLIADPADHAAARAVAAVAGAAVGDEEEDTVGVAVDQAGHRHMSVLAARVGHFTGGDDRFAGQRDDLAADRAVGVIRLDKVEVVRGDTEGEFVGGEEEAFAFGGGKTEVFFGLRESGHAVAKLPAPVAPFGFGRIGPVTGSVGAEVAEGGALGCHQRGAGDPVRGRGVGHGSDGESGDIFRTAHALRRSICAPTPLSLSSMCS